MNVHTGSYTPPRLLVALISAEPRVSAKWAFHLLSIARPISFYWNVISCGDAALARAEFAKGGYTHLLLWPAGVYFRWNALLETVKIGGLNDNGAPSAELLTTEDTALEYAPGNVEKEAIVAVCVPSLGETSLKWAGAMLTLLWPSGVLCHPLLCLNEPVAEAREKLVEMALALSPTPKFLLFIGDDMLPPPGAAQELYGAMRVPALYAKAAGVSALYYSKSKISAPVAWRGNIPVRDLPSDAMLEVSGVGLDFCILRTDMFARLDRPWFETVQTEHSRLTEDAYFWNKVRACSHLRPYVATSLRVGHFEHNSGHVY